MWFPLRRKVVMMVVTSMTMTMTTMTTMKTCIQDTLPVGNILSLCSLSKEIWSAHHLIIWSDLINDHNGIGCWSSCHCGCYRVYNLPIWSFNHIWSMTRWSSCHCSGRYPVIRRNLRILVIPGSPLRSTRVQSLSYRHLYTISKTLKHTTFAPQNIAENESQQKVERVTVALH